MSEERLRLDQLLVRRQCAPSGAKARAMIMAGEVMVNGERADKPGKRFSADASIEIRSSAPRFASRGGEKLTGALDAFSLDVAGMTALDVGASTGGFTDCLLQRGAEKVYAVDVGKGILDWRLREDPRVIVMEGVNARYLRTEDLPEQVDIAVIDVSFISLTLVLPAVAPLVRPGGAVLPMVKPQFEVGKGEVPKGGVVRDAAVRAGVLRHITGFMYNLDLTILGVAASPTPGPKGNREYFIRAERRAASGSPDMEAAIQRAVSEYD